MNLEAVSRLLSEVDKLEMRTSGAGSNKKEQMREHLVFRCSMKT